MKATCKIVGCDRPSVCRGWCNAHYTRWKRNGDTGPVEIWDKVRPQCSIEGCESPHYGRGLCFIHWQRKHRRGGDPLHVTPKSGANSPRWSDRTVLTYDAAHDRVKRANGPATLHPCITCGSQAHDWAYQHSDADPLVDQQGRPYSDDIANYAAMCRRCHRGLDVKVLADASRRRFGDVLSSAEIASEYRVEEWSVRASGMTPVESGVKPLMYRRTDVAIWVRMLVDERSAG